MILRTALLVADVTDALGYTYSAEALERVSAGDPNMEFDGKTLWYTADAQEGFSKVGISPYRLKNPLP